jgi:predicted small secreted protein
MANKKFRLGILGILSVFALSMAGCNTTQAMTQTINSQASRVEGGM